MQAQRAANQEPITGYRLLEPLGRGGFGEVWKCEAPGGLFKAIKFVQGNKGLDTTCAAEQELRSLQHIKSIRHPFLLSIERAECIDGDLIIVMELADKSLHDLLVKHQEAGQTGIPRGETLAYLHEAAEVLDLMNQEHGLQHLDIKPRNLFLVGRHIKVADFGLVNSLAEVYGQTGSKLLDAITPLYAAPETFQSKVSLFSDQYSLAVTAMELLTGRLPFSGKNMRQLLLQVTCAEPDLSPLDEADRPIFAQALNKEPRQRFASCQAFIEALFAIAPGETERMKPRATLSEFTLADPPTLLPDASGMFRRQSRVTRAVRVPPAAADTLANYQMQECLSRNSTGELWRATGPRGESCLLRYVSLSELPDNDDGLDRLMQLRHPSLPTLKRLDAGPGRLALVQPAGEDSLTSRFKTHQTTGLPGIPRQELLTWLAQAAHALDELYHLHQLQHLMLNPRTLSNAREMPLLLEFGLAELLLVPLGQQPASLNPRYAAVELFDGLVSDACDQYSLALMYQEMLVGLHPYRNLTARQLASPRLRGQPELSLLPAPDRDVVMQALAPEPDKRFRSCREFILALEEATIGMQPVSPSRLNTRVVTVIQSQPVDDWPAVVDQIVQEAGRTHLVQPLGTGFYRLMPGVEVAQHVVARLAAGMARLKLAGFAEHWKAEILERTDERWLLEAPAKVSLWQRCMGKTPGMLVEVTFGGPPTEANGGLTTIDIRLHPRDCSRTQADNMLNEMAPAVLGSLQTYFGSQASRQDQEQFPLMQAVHVHVPATGLSITIQTRQVSRKRFILVSPCELPLGVVQLTVNRWGSPLTVRASGRVQACRPSGHGQYEVEVALGLSK